MTYAQPGQEGSVEISYTLKCEEPVWIFGYSGAIQLKLAFVAQLEGCITKMDS